MGFKDEKGIKKSEFFPISLQLLKTILGAMTTVRKLDVFPKLNEG